jgi:hypothetical protein
MIVGEPVLRHLSHFVTLSLCGIVPVQLQPRDAWAKLHGKSGFSLSKPVESTSRGLSEARAAPCEERRPVMMDWTPSSE